jgi:hypothetical protein
VGFFVFAAIRVKITADPEVLSPLLLSGQAATRGNQATSQSRETGPERAYP